MRCFAIMPFADAFDDVWQSIRAAVSEAVAGAECRRLDEVKAAGRITDDLVQALGDADLCIADLTGLNANVMWEVGFAMALGRPVLLLSQDVRTLPFDLRQMRTLAYDPGAGSDPLRADLVAAIRATLGDPAAAGDAGWRPSRRTLLRGRADGLRRIEGGDVQPADSGGWAQVLPRVELVRDDDRVHLRASYELHQEGRDVLAGTLRGSGIVESGSACITYTIEDESGTQRIAGVLQLVLPQFGRIAGYYLAASHAKPGKTILGAIELDRIDG